MKYYFVIFLGLLEKNASNYLQFEITLRSKIWSRNEKTIRLADQIIIWRLSEELSEDWRLVQKLKNYLEIGKLPEDWKYVRSIWYLDWRSIWKLKNYLKIKELSANWRTICRSNFDLQITLQSVDNFSICIWNTALICR